MLDDREYGITRLYSLTYARDPEGSYYGRVRSHLSQAVYFYRLSNCSIPPVRCANLEALASSLLSAVHHSAVPGTVRAWACAAAAAVLEEERQAFANSLTL